MTHDRCASVEDQLHWMRLASLAEVGSAFKAWRFAELGEKRPA